MKKKFLLFVLLVLSSFTLIAQNNEKDETYLINEIGEFELKKKKLFDTFTNGRVIRENAMDEAINKIFMKKEEVKYKRYRAAELLEDGMTPAEVAIDERVASYNHVREDAINYCKDKIENELLLQKQINELEEYYDNIENTTDRTISTLGNELRVASVGYNGDKKGWILNICVNFGSIENFYTTSVLPYKLLTGKDPIEYGEYGFEEFCDEVDYYEELIDSGELNLVFELSYNINADFTYEGINTQIYTYETEFKDFTYYNSSDENKEKHTLNLTKYPTEYKEIKSEYDIEDALNFYKNFENELAKRAEELFAKEYMTKLDKPLVVPDSTSGSDKENSRYAFFGLWPQSIKKQDVTINTTKAYSLNGWKCYKGSDNNYYVKQKALPNEELDDEITFSNRESIEKGKEYYFKIEPIKWRIVTDDYQGKTLLVSETALFTSSFDNHSILRKDKAGNEINPSNYKYSRIRAYLNGFNGTNYDEENFTGKGFINKAFTKNAINNIETVDIDGDLDKAFLLSESELDNEKYKFKRRGNRGRESTDYILATGVEQSNRYSPWWLRSPCYKDKAYYINCGGYHVENENVQATSIAIVPSITVLEDSLNISDSFTEVLDFKTVYEGNKLVFSWTNPNYDEFDKVIISIKGFRDIEVEGVRGKAVTKVISGLSPETNYNFKVKVLYDNGVTSHGISKNIYTKVNNTMPKLCGSEGSYDEKGVYVLFGRWPQSLKDKRVKVDTSKAYKLNGWKCYKGSDGGYYVKTKATPFDKNNRFPEDFDKINDTFNDGSKIEKDEEYYFKIEPIKWRALLNDPHYEVLLVAESILLPSSFYDANDVRTIDGEEVYENNYQYSKVRAYLNGLDGSNYGVGDFTNKGFINMAFSSSEQKMIQECLIDNGIEAVKDNDGYLEASSINVCKPTKDKVFLLSQNEVTRTYNGFDDHDKRDEIRQRATTDYSKALGVFSRQDNMGIWRLRSPTHQHDYGDWKQCTFVNEEGMSNPFGYYVKDTNSVSDYLGIVPCISLPADTYFIPTKKYYEVSNLDVEKYGTKVVLNWINPDVYNLDKVIISVNGKDVSEIKVEKGKKNTKVFKNLQREATYNFNLRTVLKDGTVSNGIDTIVKATSYTHIKPRLLPKDTYGIMGKDTRYLLFGYWPTDRKPSSVKIDTSITDNVNGWECYSGSDGYYYINEDEVYYRLEPIKWCVIDEEYQGAKLLVCENIIENKCFFNDVSSRKINDQYLTATNYQYSNVRAYLNGLDGSSYNVEDYTNKGFINKAFSKESLKYINTVSLDGNDEIKDKIFILSEDEVPLEEEYTPWVRMTSFHMKGIDYTYNNTKWWLRTPSKSSYGSDSTQDIIIIDDNCYYFSDTVPPHTEPYKTETEDEDIGIVPSLTIKF